MAEREQDSAVLDPETSGDSRPTFYLSGGVVGCACPDCGSPMSIRLWLMAADCLHCGCNIELTEEDEREIRQLLEQSVPAEAAPAVPVAKPVEPPVQRQAPAPEAKPAPPPQPEPAPMAEPAPRRGRRASDQPIGVRKHLDQVQRGGEVSVLLSEAKEDLPAWLVSAVVHLILLILLAMFVMEPKKEVQDILMVSSEADDAPLWDLDNFSLEDEELAPFEQENDVAVNEEPTEPVEVPQETLAAAEAPAEIEAPPIPELNPLPAIAGELTPGTVQMFNGRDERARGELVRAYGGNSRSEAAVAMGLRWLAKVQNNDGHWDFRDHGGSVPSNTGGTGLALLPFLGAGCTHEEGQFKETVRRGLYYLIKQQRPDGDLRGRGKRDMYCHAIAALALCEAYAMTRDPELKAAAQAAVDFIVKAQHHGGGWRYNPGDSGDTSVVGWQVMALRSAQVAYLEVPKETFAKVTNYLDDARVRLRGRDNNYAHGYGYQPGASPTRTMTAEALLCRQYQGMPRNHADLSTGVELMTEPEGRPQERGFNIYYYYYASQVLHHYGGEAWFSWNAEMRDLLVESQEQRGPDRGSWDPRGQWSPQGGRLMQTCLSLLILEVYYRHLPIYQESAVPVAGK